MAQTPLSSAVADPLTPAEVASRPWRELTFVAFDTETTGKYPLEAEICEIAAVKWRDGKIIETFETLIKPSMKMGAEVIKIHGITNEMVESAPRMSEKISEFHSFILDAIPVAHHAPFDLGFVAVEFEKAGLSLPSHAALCSSLLSRKLVHETQNHRLQTLVRFFDLPKGTAHRALDDAKACLEVALRCLQRTGEDAELGRAFDAQGGALTWARFSMKELESEAIGRELIRSIREKKIVELVYMSGSKPGQMRRVHPLGLVRSLDGDFVVAWDESEQINKRYFLSDVASVKIAN